MTNTSTKIMIAHRGNVDGPCERENQPLHILAALALGYHAEIDVWWHKENFWLGHDKPEHMIGEQFLQKKKKWLWCHAKNIEALKKLLEMKIHCFFHDQDDCTLTSKGYIWTYPGKEITEGSIAVMPERVPDWDISKAAGICTDFPKEYATKNLALLHGKVNNQ